MFLSDCLWLLQITKPPYLEVAKTMVEMRVAENENVNQTAKTVTYCRSGAAGRAANCCNDAKPACAC